MPAFQIDFSWSRDTKGYRLIPEEPPDPRHAHVILGGEGKSARIIRRGGRLERYQPLERFEKLFFEFQKLTTGDDLLRFVEKFGPLTEAGLDQARGENVDILLSHAKGMRQLLTACTSKGKADVARLLADGETIVPKLARLEASLALGSRKAFRLRLGVPDLLSGLWLQLGQSIAGGAKVCACRLCGAFFEAGVGTGRRGDAKFCSDEHRITFNSHARFQGGSK